MKEIDKSDKNEFSNKNEDPANNTRLNDNEDSEERINNLNLDINNNEDSKTFDRLYKLQKLIKKESTLRELSKNIIIYLYKKFKII